MTATALPPMVTVASSPVRSGAEKGIGGAGWGAPDAGLWPAGFPADERVGYDLATIRRWLDVFCRRFFGFAQFKRSALPNGPKVVRGGSLSPRGDWRMPSDTPATLWLADLERIPD